MSFGRLSLWLAGDWLEWDFYCMYTRQNRSKFLDTEYDFDSVSTYIPRFPRPKTKHMMEFSKMTQVQTNGWQ